MILKIGTRGSKLAFAQSRWVKREVETRNPDIRVELIRVKTTGDKILDSPLSRVGGKGLFVKEIEEALSQGKVDLAVHSMKDVPAQLPLELGFAAFPKREDPRDAFLSIRYRSLQELPSGATVGTSSLRRAAQLLHLRPDLRILPLRGNVDTRLRKLEAGECQALILAAAGLKRLGLEGRIVQILTEEMLLPAIGQGALGLEVRNHDERTIELLTPLNDVQTEATVRAERAFLRELEGGCQVPVAAFCRPEKGGLHLRGLVAELDGTGMIRDEIRGERDQGEEIGVTLARRLLDAGADDILARIHERKP